MPANVHLLDHPLIQHKLTLMRKKETSTTSFRRLLNEIGSLMAYEVTRDMPMHDVIIQTPLETMMSPLRVAATALAWARPVSLSRMSVEPWMRRSRFQSVSPWRTRVSRVTPRA